MTDRIVQDGVVRAVNDQQRQVAALEALGLSGDLAASEAASWRRYIPRARLPWTEVVRYEEEVSRLEERRREIEEKRLELSDRLRGAPGRDLESLAAWERSGRRGPRPEPSGPALEAELERLQQDERGVLHAVNAVTADRARFVAKHRRRLVEEANRYVEEKRARASEALEQYEQARAALVEARSVSLWASLYPDGEAGREPNFAALAGGLRRVGEAIGLQQATSIELIIGALREDLTWLVGACTPAQRAKLDPKPVTQAEVDRERDRAVEGALSIYSQGRADQRRGQLDRMKAKL